MNANFLLSPEINFLAHNQITLYSSDMDKSSSVTISESVSMRFTFDLNQMTGEMPKVGIVAESRGCRYEIKFVSEFYELELGELKTCCFYLDCVEVP